MAPLVGAVSHTKPASPGHIWAVFPLQFNLTYYTEGFRIAGLKLLSGSRTFWKYFLQHNEAAVLKYGQFLFEYFLSFLTSSVLSLLFTFIFRVNHTPSEQNAIFFKFCFCPELTLSFKVFLSSCTLFFNTALSTWGTLFYQTRWLFSPWHPCTSQTCCICENALINKKHFSHVPTRSVQVNTEMDENLKILAQIR